MLMQFPAIQLYGAKHRMQHGLFFAQPASSNVAQPASYSQ